MNMMRNPLLFKAKVIQTIFLSVYTAGLLADLDRGLYPFFNPNLTVDYTQYHWRMMTGYFFYMGIATFMLAL